MLGLKSYRFGRNLAKSIPSFLSRSCTTTPESTGTDQQMANPHPEEPIIVEKENNITLIGINRPKVRNAIDSITGRKLSAAIAEFENDPKADVSVLHGIGGSFCSGYDLSELAGQQEPQQALSIVHHPEGVMGPTRRMIRKPLVCAITGYCVAGGLELALMCDLRVMEENAVLGFFNRRFGVPLIDGGTVRLPALIGLSRALDLILTGRTVTAKEALDIGLVNRVVAVGAGLGQAYNLAMSIAKYPQLCIRHDRDAAYYGTFSAESFEQALEREAANVTVELLQEAKEGADKFRQGIGRGGSFSGIKERKLPDWERAEMKHESKL
ncbi:putative enoyl-CoA hydratase/isomerase YngF [Anopheles gambiae]|uniref:putative enoyl-CoA hydratase/isomerase YngF n=1 Tax=Anopheles gambiae TaxID=7165 RepID=UPI002AC9ECFF|nr:putative enoyl-CoA hydratase/isomerase YngF [Anopheles gambiae]